MIVILRKVSDAYLEESQKSDGVFISEIDCKTSHIRFFDI